MSIIQLAYILACIDENIGNHEYIGNLILWIYKIYRQIFWKKISVGQKLIKTHGNVRKTS